MNLFGFIKRSVLFYRRRNVGLFLTAVISTAVLTGALLVGDSVRYSLERIVKLRLGRTETVLTGDSHFFGVGLAERISEKLNMDTAPILQLAGMVSNSDGSRRINRMQVLGVDSRFFEFGGAEDPFADRAKGIVLNQQAAEKLGAAAGDEVLLRIGKPGVLSRDIGLMPESDFSVVYRGEVIDVVGDEGFGRFGLAANQVAPFNVFVPLDWLGRKIEKEGLCNTVLMGAGSGASKLRDEALIDSLDMEDVGLELRKLPDKDAFEVRSRRVFIGDFLADAALKVKPSTGYLTYFVNGISFGDKVTPYSMVAAVGGIELGSRDIIVNQWLAEDLGVMVGDKVELDYYIPGENRKLETGRSKFVVREIIGMDSELSDRELMPDFPGLSDEENCRDWDPGIPVDLDKIRNKDEVYWDDYRGTPKAFVSLDAGRRMWANRFGNLTSVQYPVKGNSPETTAAKILANIGPWQSGLVFTDVRAAGFKAGGEATDFGQLFLGLSMFLIAAGMMLTGLVFAFGIERRRQEAGMLLAVGFSRAVVRRMFLFEAGLTALAGAAVGSLLGLIYTKAMVAGLSSVWENAVAGTAIVFHWKILTVLLGAACGFSVSLFSVWLTLRHHLKERVHELLSWSEEFCCAVKKRGTPRFRIELWGAGIFTFASIITVTVFRNNQGQAAAGAFFGAASLLLISGIMLVRYFLKDFGAAFGKMMAGLYGFAWKNASRRSGRSAAVVAMVAVGSFLVISIGVFRQGIISDVSDRNSGTGGFDLFAESSIPIVADLDSDAEREKLGFDRQEFMDLRIVKMRVRDGDDASCLNLNRAQRPRVLGVDPAGLDMPKAFGDIKVVDEYKERRPGWNLLDEYTDDGVVNAIADKSTVVWALGKKLGDIIEYVDESGREFSIRIAGTIENSVLQGNLVISESSFVERYPSQEGYRMFLVDVPAEKRVKVSQNLSDNLIDYGVEVSTTGERLNRFNSVQNTYLSIFQVLGALGVLLGSVGLGLIVHINVLERRGELAMLRAVGFDRNLLKRMILLEHVGLLAVGLVCGILAALIAVLPALTVRPSGIEAGFVAIIVALITFSGIISVRVSAGFALGGKLIEALRNE